MKAVPRSKSAAMASGSGSGSVSSSSTAVEVPSLKVVIVGDYGVGKTSLIRQLTQRQFLANSGTTIGVEFKEQRFPNAVLQIWDIAGQQYMSSMTKQYYRWASAAIVCVDLTKDSTFDVALDWRRDVLEKVGGPVPNTSQSPPRGPTSEAALFNASNQTECAIPIFLFVNKSDLMSQTSRTPESLQLFALEHGFTDMMLTSAKDYQNVCNAFQHVATFVVETQDSLGVDASRNGAGSSAINLNALRRSVRSTSSSNAEHRGEKKCCN